MLNSSQLEEQKNRFLEFNAVNSVFPTALLDYLGADLYTAPASSNKDMYGCYPGGLLEHMFKISTYMFNFNKFLPKKYETSIITKTGMLSQIGKVFQFEINESEWHRNNLGRMYNYAHEDVSLKLGERSLFMAISHGVIFTEVEYQAIMNMDKDDTDKQSKYFTKELGVLLKTAIELSIIESKNISNG